MHKKFTIQEAEMLLEKYYGGFTSKEEEKYLYTFLSQKNLPERFEADKAMLSYFASYKKKSKTPIVPLIRWTSIAASVLIGITAAHFLMPAGKSGSFAYVDGKKITDIAQIKEQALFSLNSLNNSDNETNLNTDDLINQQLQLFTK